MTKAYRTYAPVLLLCTASVAHSASTDFAMDAQQTTYSNSFGKRRQAGFESSTDLGSTAFVVGLTRGKRSFADESYSANRVSGTVFQNWSDRFYSRTNVALSSNKPVFATREFSTDLNYKVLDKLVVTAGGKQARYFGKRDVLSWSAGGSWYFRGGYASYRFTSYDVDGIGRTHGHLASFRLKDPKGPGSTQLWLGTGTSLHEQDIAFSGRLGKFRSVSLRRVQPIAGPLSATFSLGRGWYETGAEDYHGTTAAVGLSFSRLLKL